MEVILVKDSFFAKYFYMRKILITFLIVGAEIFFQTG